MKLFIESEISYFDKSILKSPKKKIVLDESFWNFSNKGENMQYICNLQSH